MSNTIPAPMRAEIKRLVRDARERRGMTLEQLAAATGRKVKTLREYERSSSPAHPGFRLGLALSALLDAPGLVDALQRAALASLGL